MKIRYTNLLFIAFLTTTLLTAQQRIFERDQVTIYSENNEKVAYIDTIFKGKKALKLDGKLQSLCILEGITAKNFRIEMDIAGEVMSGLGFHVKDGLNYQYVYFRPGLGGTREAIQYIPIYNGALSWVFYNYPTYETTADIASLEWFHAAFEVSGNRLKVFVNGQEEPKMDVTLLENTVSGEKLLLRGLFGPSYFANITYQPLSEENAEIKKAPKTNFLTKWKISQQFPSDTTASYFQHLLKKANQLNNWKEIRVPEDPYVNFSRFFEYPKGVLVAKNDIYVENSTHKKLYFDYVGKISIVLNGTELFQNNKIKFERVFDGTFSINLPLNKGNNELIVIAEGDAPFFGEGFRYLGRNQHSNWGFIARLEE